MKAESRWGSSFVDNLSKDLQKTLPNVKGFSRTNIFLYHKILQTLY